MNGLKLEPGCRALCVARLNLLRWKLRPPVSARIAPSLGSSATSAPCTFGNCESAQPFSSSGARRTMSPGLNTASTRLGAAPRLFSLTYGRAQATASRSSSTLSSLPR